MDSALQRVFDLHMDVIRDRPGQAGPLSNDLANAYEGTLAMIGRATELIWWPTDSEAGGSSNRGWQLPPGGISMLPPGSQLPPDFTIPTNQALIDGFKFRSGDSIPFASPSSTESDADIIRRLEATQTATQNGFGAVDEIERRILAGLITEDEVADGFASKTAATETETGTGSAFELGFQDGIVTDAFEGIGGRITAASDSRGGRHADGRRVSREPHEYRYCQESGQIGDILVWIIEASSNGPNADDVSEWMGERVDAVVGPSGDGTLSLLLNNVQPSRFSYGNFVDAALFRKAIAVVRKLRRTAYAANVKAILDILDLDQEEVFRDMVLAFIGNEERFGPVVTELAEIFLDSGVADSTGNMNLNIPGNGTV